MKKYIFIKILQLLFLLLFLIISCKQNSIQKGKKETIPIESAQKSDDDEWAVQRRQYDSLIAQIPNRVLLDTLLEKLTRQQNVKVISDAGDSFKIKIANNGNTVFYDGKKKIAFRDYKVTCYDDKKYICNDFGFNSYNNLDSPKIIEVCGKKFLYADVEFPCNGMGCGNRLTMIYDLKEKKPTFTGNFRLPFDKFLLSDFNDDGVPDLLVTATTRSYKIIRDDIPEFQMKLLVYTYRKGQFILDKNNFIDLNVIGDDNSFDKAYYVEKNCWFKME